MKTFSQWLEQEHPQEGDLARSLASIGIGMGTGLVGNALLGPAGIPAGLWLGTKLAGKYLPYKGELDPIDKKMKKMKKG